MFIKLTEIWWGEGMAANKEYSRDVLVQVSQIRMISTSIQRNKDTTVVIFSNDWEITVRETADEIMRLSNLETSEVEESQPDGHPLQVKISNALILADQYNQIEGEHHQNWLLDQVVRALTGCEFVIKHDAAGPYIDERDPGRPSDEYTAWIKAFNETHGGEPWHPGMAP